MATYTLDEVMAEPGPRTYSLEEVVGATPKPDKLLSRTDKFVKGALDPVVGIGQLTQHMLPQSILDRANVEMNAMGAPMGVSVQPGQLDQQIAQDEQQYQANRAGAGESGIDGYRMLGNIFNPLTMMPAAKIPQAATLGGKALIGAGVGGAMGGMQPVTSGDFDTEKQKQVGAGAIGGALVPVAVGGVSRIISPKASTNASVNLLKKEGVTPTVGQTLGGAWNRAEEKLMSIPIVGDLIGSARGRANVQLERAAYNRALEPIGKKLPMGLNGREALVHTENALKQNYDDVLNKIGAITPDEQFSAKIASLRSMVNSMRVPENIKNKFLSAVDDVNAHTKDGVITSESFKALESKLGTKASKLAASMDVDEGDVAPAVKQLQAELREMLQRQAGESADDLQKTNLAWANFKRVQNAAGKIGADEGSFTPAQLQSSVRSMDKSKDKAAFARGGALMQDLGDAGKNVLGSRVPNSGTADRLLYGGGTLAAGAAYLEPTLGAGLLGGAAMYSTPAQRFLNSIVSSRPESARTVAEALRQNSQYMLPAGSIAGLGLLNQ